MRIAIIGRSELLYHTAALLMEKDCEIVLIVTAKAAREYRVTSDDFRALAKRIGARFIHTTKINDPAIMEEIKGLGTIDIGISMNYTGIISGTVIDLFTHGILNAHGGDLPRYKGNACQAWAIIHGEERIGLCIHKMVGDELDSGPIIARDYYPLTIDSRIGEVYDWMNQRIPELMLEAIERLTGDGGFHIDMPSKEPASGLRCYPRRLEDGKIDWHASNTEIVRLINASSEPYGGAFCHLDGETLIIWRAALYDDGENYLAVPGQVARTNKPDGSVIVITGAGKIKLMEIEYRGQRTPSPAKMITSMRTRLT